MLCDLLIIAFTFLSFISGAYIAYATNKMVNRDTVWKSNGQYFILAYSQIEHYLHQTSKSSIPK